MIYHDIGRFGVSLGADARREICFCSYTMKNVFLNVTRSSLFQSSLARLNTGMNMITMRLTEGWLVSFYGISTLLTEGNLYLNLPISYPHSRLLSLTSMYLTAWQTCTSYTSRSCVTSNKKLSKLLLLKGS